MNKEEKEIIHTLEGSINTYIEGTKVIRVQLTTKQAEILLNLISKLQKELDKKDKVIDLMADYIYCKTDFTTVGKKRTVKEYFYKKAEEEND